MFFSFWNWFFEVIAPTQPHLAHLGTFIPLQSDLFLLQPTGRFETHIQKAIYQNAPPPNIPNRWGGPRNIQSILRFRSLVQAGASIQSGSKLQEIIWHYHKHQQISIMDAATQIHKAILSFGDALILYRKAQLSSSIQVRIRFESPTLVNKTGQTIVRSIQLNQKPIWYIEIQRRTVTKFRVRKNYLI